MVDKVFCAADNECNWEDEDASWDETSQCPECGGEVSFIDT